MGVAGVKNNYAKSVDEVWVFGAGFAARDRIQIKVFPRVLPCEAVCGHAYPTNQIRSTLFFWSLPMREKTQNLFSDPQYAPSREEKGPRPAPSAHATRTTHAGSSVRACDVCKAKEGFSHPITGVFVKLVLYQSRSGEVQVCQRCLAWAKGAKQ